MAIIRWRPMEGNMREIMNRMFEDATSWPRNVFRNVEGYEPIPLDVYEDGTNLVVKATLPGMKVDDINVSIQENVLTITGETRMEEERKEKQHHIREQFYGKFERSIMLPYPIQIDKADSEYRDGILTLTLPKSEEARAKRIEVKQK
jgi:HSP20 family protein